MRGFIFLLLLALSSTGWGAALTEAYRGADTHLLAQVRKGFETAPESAAETRRLIKTIDESLPVDLAQWPPIFLAYRAALAGLAGKHSLRPWTKYQHAKVGLAKFHGLVETYPESIEIRMLRYSASSQLPDFFQMQPQAAADLKVLTELFTQGADPMVPKKLSQGYLRWILDHGQPAPEIRKQLEAVLAAPN